MPPLLRYGALELNDAFIRFRGDFNQVFIGLALSGGFLDGNAFFLRQEGSDHVVDIGTVALTSKAPLKRRWCRSACG